MNYYHEIKNKLIDVEVYKHVKDYSKNRYEVTKYYEVGKLLIEAQGGEARAKYGDGLIKEYSKKLMQELDKKYSYRNLMSMRKFYLLFKNEKVNAMRSQLSWTHYRELLVLKNINEVNYYIGITIKRNLSYRKLHEVIKSNEYRRLSEDVKLKLINKKDVTIGDSIKHPIIIRNKFDTEDISEKMLKTLILDDITNFMHELGNDFCFIDSEYKIIINNTYNYIDLLLFNIEYNCYIVIELKVTELKKEHIGQIHVYMNYIDKNLRRVNQDKTIGIIIVKKDNQFIMEYCSDDRIYHTNYELIK